MFTIATNTTADMRQLPQDLSSWPVPSIAALKGTTLGAARFSAFYAFDAGSDLPIEQKFDALLYLGPPEKLTKVELPRSLCADPSYIQMRTKRTSIVPGAAQQITELQQYCAGK